MKVLHAASSTDPAIGVSRQMRAEQTAADRLGLDWSSRFFVPADADAALGVRARAPAADRVAFKREYYAWLAAQMKDHDVLVLRYLRYDIFQYLFLRGFSKPVFLVHHTLEGPQIEQEGGPLAPLKYRLDELLVKRCHALASGLIAVTDEIIAYERSRGLRSSPTYCYPNGIAYEPVSALDERNADLPELLFVASRFVEWHGLDLLIDAAGQCDRACRVHVVGEVSEAQRGALSGDPRFVVHGRLRMDALMPIMRRCSLGLGSFALFRKRMRQACTLKVREYLMAGLPVYAGHEDVFGDDMRWFRNGPCDLSQMLAFADEVAATPRATVALQARPWIDKEPLLMRLHDWLEAVVADRADREGTV